MMKQCTRGNSNVATGKGAGMMMSELKCGRARELDDATGRRALSQQKQERVRELRCCNTERYSSVKEEDRCNNMSFSDWNTCCKMTVFLLERNVASNQPHRMFVNRKGNQRTAKLSVRITRDSDSAVAGDALKQVQTSKQKLSEPFVSKASDALPNASDTLSNQQNLLTSFNSLIPTIS